MTKQMMQILAATLIAAAPATAFAQTSASPTTYPKGFDCATLTGDARTDCEQQLKMDPNTPGVTKPNNDAGQGADPSDPDTDVNSSNVQPDTNGATNSGSTN
jgi:hypothetical protein